MIPPTSIAMTPSTGRTRASTNPGASSAMETRFAFAIVRLLRLFIRLVSTASRYPGRALSETEWEYFWKGKKGRN